MDLLEIALLTFMIMFNEDEEDNFVEEILARFILRREEHPKIENYFENVVPRYSTSGNSYYSSIINSIFITKFQKF